MKPEPIVLVAIVAATASLSRPAGAGDFAACATIASASARLACYDRAASAPQGAHTRASMASLPDFTPGKPLHTQHTDPKTGRTEREAAPSITVRIASFTSTDGHTIFNLENGQVWQSQDDDPVFPYDGVNEATIVQTPLGYHLRINQQARQYVVKRIE